MDENKRGFHRSSQPDTGGGGKQGADDGMGSGIKCGGKSAPTVHNGPYRQGESDARINSFRNAHRSPQLGPIIK